MTPLREAQDRLIRALGDAINAADALAEAHRGGGIAGAMNAEDARVWSARLSSIRSDVSAQRRYYEERERR